MTTDANEGWRKRTRQYVKARPPQFGPLTESDIEQIADYMADSWKLVTEVTRELRICRYCRQGLPKRRACDGGEHYTGSYNGDSGYTCIAELKPTTAELLAAISEKLEGR
jgi:DICT domain-containing protein